MNIVSARLHFISMLSHEGNEVNDKSWFSGVKFIKTLRNNLWENLDGNPVWSFSVMCYMIQDNIISFMYIWRTFMTRHINDPPPSSSNSIHEVPVQGRKHQ